MTLMAESRYDVRISCSSSRGSMRSGVMLMASTSLPSDVEVGHVAGVGLDELAPRLDLVAHEHREHALGLRGVVHGHLDKGARPRVHRRLLELGRVHLAQ